MTRVGFELGCSRLLCSDDVTTSAKALQSILAILKSTFMGTRAQVFLMRGWVAYLWARTEYVTIVMLLAYS